MGASGAALSVWRLHSMGQALQQALGERHRETIEDASPSETGAAEAVLAVAGCGHLTANGRWR
jgi:hypothetical protein